MTPFRRFASVCALLLVTATLAAAAPSSDDQVIVPGHTAETPAAPVSSASRSFGLVTVVGIIVCLGAGGWLLWRGRGLSIGGRVARQLTVDETRSLGSRQYLVVASYQDKKFLLGVCPGRIDLLAPLHEPAPDGKHPSA
jgi:flagellar protein FliO/FliZ